MFSKEGAGVGVAVKEVLERANLFREWFALFGRYTVNPVVEECGT
jgi:hypothetical protein